MSAEFMRIKDVLRKHFPWVGDLVLGNVVRDLLAAVEPAPDLDRAEALIEKAGELRANEKRLKDLEEAVARLVLDLAQHKSNGHGLGPLGGQPYTPPPPFAPVPTFPYVGDPVPAQPWLHPTPWWQQQTITSSYKDNPNTGTGGLDG